MTSASGGSGPALIGMFGNVAILLISVAIYRRRDREAFSGDARRVFTRLLAGLYLTGAVFFWIATLAAYVFLFATGRSSWRPSNPAAVLAGFVLIGGYVLVVFLVQSRAQAASTELDGPVGQLGRFIRLGYGTAVPAASRRLRSPA